MTAVAVGPEILVSTTNATDQIFPQITALTDGRFAVTWWSNNSDYDSDIRGRVFAADGTPVNASDFLVSTSNANYQGSPAITALADGGFAVTWWSYDNSSYPDIRGRVFAADGTAVTGSDFGVSTSNAGNQRGQQITALADGGFAVTWESYDNGSNYDVRGRVFAADGTPINGSDFLVSTSNANDQDSPTITALANGGFAVMWRSDDNGPFSDIRGRVFAADGTPINSNDFLVPTNNFGLQMSQQITALANGGFAVTWGSSAWEQGLSAGEEGGIRGRVFAADGTAVAGSDFLVSTSNAGNGGAPRITALANGGFAVTWESRDNGSNYDVRGRVFAADGTPINGSDFLVSTSNANDQDSPTITALADGGVAVMWRSLDNGPYPDIRGRVFAADGRPVGGDFLVAKTFGNGSQGFPQITALADGDFVVTWHSSDNGSNNSVIHAQVFAVNEVPAVTAPGGLATHEDTALVVNGFTVDDADNSQLTVTLTATGKLTLSQTDGLVFTDGDGTADQRMTLSGAIADINAALAGMTYAPTADFNGTGGFDYTLDDGVDRISGRVAINIDAVNDAPRITSNGGGAAASVSVSENLTAVTTVTVADPDAGQTPSYSISGADAGKFAIDPNTGTLRFITAPNFEAPTDMGGNNVYDVTVLVSDGHGGTDSQAIAVTVMDFDEVPTITSNGGGAAASVFVLENSPAGTAVTTVTATNPEVDQTLSYWISGGADARYFYINNNTGELFFFTTPNFEAPTDMDGNNVYDVSVYVFDGHSADFQTIAVTVTNANEAPTITSNGGSAAASISILENSTAVTTVTATDPDAGQTLSYSIIGGADASKFIIGSSTGALSFVTAPDFELPTDAGGNNVYDVIVQASDGHGGVDTQAIAIRVTDSFDNSVPTITSNGGGNTAVVSIAENTSAVTTVAATDPDAGQTPSYSIIGGADASRFIIGSSTGALSFVTAPNFELPADAGGNNVYDVVVQVSDGHGGTDSQAIAVTVTNANEVPTITSNGGGAAASVSVLENSKAVTMVTATDPDAGQTLSYSIIGGADAGKFTIGYTGALSFIVAPNFEAPTDAGGNNVYDVIVQASDGHGGIDTQALAITVTDLFDNIAPIITSNGGGNTAVVSVAENTTAGTTVAATDPDAGQTLSYSIIGGADAGKLTIGYTGALSFIAAPNFEAPTDTGADNIYDLIVQVSDGNGGIDTQAIAVTVANANDAAVPSVPTHNFNGDAKSDILWQNDNGTAGIWLMDGMNPIAAAAVGSNPGPSWHVKDTGDFNGDGKSDILWQNDDGTAGIWLMDGMNPITAAAVGSNPGPSWHVKDTGDFNGDGKSDILWQNDNGTAGIWLMDGMNPIAAAAVGSNPGPSWHVKDTGDFNGDGKSDILWQNDDGTAGIWLMDGMNPITAAAVGSNPGPSWHVKDTGDFNGDGKSDILWQNDNGTAGIWLMDGMNPIAAAAVGANPGPSWHVKDTGDFNGDGKSDILWQNDNGTAGIWLMDGMNPIAAAAVGSNPGQDWHLL